MTFTPLASSSAACAYVVDGKGAAPLLVDVGLTASTIRDRYGYGIAGFAGCLVSHAHSDHCKGARSVAAAGVRVFATKETIRDVPGLSASPFVVPVEPGEEFECDGWRIKAFSARHDAEGTVGFLIDGYGGRLLYLTDTAFSDVTFSGVTHWAVEANFDKEIIREREATRELARGRFARTHRNHMSIDRTVRMLKANDLSRAREIWLLHLSDENSDEAAFRRAVMSATGVATFVAPAHAVDSRTRPALSSVVGTTGGGA